MNPNQRFGVVPTATAIQTDGLTFLRNMISQHYPAPPFAETSDIWIILADHWRVLFEARPAEKFLNPLGTIHGGWISTLLDSAMGCAVHSMLKPGHRFTTVDMTVSCVPCCRRPANSLARARSSTRVAASLPLKGALPMLPAS